MDSIDDRDAVSIVVPTRNRAYTIGRVARSWYEQEAVVAIIFVDDAGDDDTPAVVAAIAADFPAVSTVVLRNEERLGAAASRKRGAAHARTAIVLFCDDDEYLEAGYVRRCAHALRDPEVGVASGRRVYMRGDETPAETIARYENGIAGLRYFRPLLCEFNDHGYLHGTVEMPLVNAVMATRASDLKRYGFDPAYARGNGYREESDYQLNLFVNGYRNLMISDVHSIHLDLSQVPSGGARLVPKRGRTRLEKLFWMLVYTNYFYAKYWDRYALRMGLWMPRFIAMMAFTAHTTRLVILLPLWKRLARHAAPRRRPLPQIPVAAGGPDFATVGSSSCIHSSQEPS